MRIVVEFPDAFAARLGGTPETLATAAREALAVEAYRHGQLTEYELGELLGLPTREAVDTLLTHHGVPLEYTWADLKADRETLRHWREPAAGR